MGWLKRDLVHKAFEELALAGYEFDLSPEEESGALLTLDAMMGEWSAQDIDVGYFFGLTPDETDLGQESGLPLSAVRGVYLALAMAIASSKGKTPPRTLVTQAFQAKNAILGWVAKAQMEATRSRRLPRGAGNRRDYFYGVPYGDPLPGDN